MEHEKMNFEQSFDINKVSFNNVNSEFEKKFRDCYNRSLNMMSDRDRLTNIGGAISLGVLEAMAKQIYSYDKESDFSDCYNNLRNELEVEKWHQSITKK